MSAESESPRELSDAPEQRSEAAALLVDEERLRLAASAAGIGVYDYDCRLRRWLLSTPLMAMFDVDSPHLADRSETEAVWCAQIHPDDLEAYLASVSRSFDSNGAHEHAIEFRVLRQGKVRWLRDVGRVLFAEDGGGSVPVRWIGVIMDVTQQKAIEETLLESENWFRMVADTAPVLLWLTDENHQCIYLNRGWHIFTGQTEQQGWGMGWTEPVHPDDRVSATETFLEAASRREEFRLYYRLRRADGQYRWAIDAGRPRLGPDGQFMGYVGSVVDVHERVIAEEALRESESRFRTLADTVPQLVWTALGDGTVTYYNSQMTRYAGVAQKPDRTWAWQPMVHADDFETTMASWQASIESGNTYQCEHRVRMADGSYRWHLSRAYLAGTSDSPIWFGTATDVHDLKLAEDSIRESEERFRNLADNVSQFAWMADNRGQIYWYNQRWYEYTGTTIDEMQGWGWTQVLHPDYVQGVAERIQHSWDTGEPWEDTFPLRGKDGQYRWYLSRALPIRDASGTVIRWFGTNTDITKQRDLELALREADRRKDEFLATLAHELRNPLAPLRSGLEMMRLVNDQPETIAEIRETMHRQLSHLVVLVDDLMDVARISQGKLQLRKRNAQLSRIVDDALTLCKPVIEENRHELHLVLVAHDLSVFGDPHRLTQVVANLVNNAAKYTPPQGRISVTVGCCSGKATITVSDNGIGIAKEKLPSVFEMFSQIAKADSPGHTGLGIGLALVKSLVEMHEGSIEAHSDGEGKGASFIVQLPVVASSPDADVSDTAKPLRPVASTTWRILVADDNTAAASLLSLILSKLGNQVRTAHDGESAVNVAREFLPHLIIMDIGMPVMDGREAAKAIRAEPWGKSMTLVALTGWGREEDIQQSREAGFDRHLVKPVDSVAIHELLDELTERADQGDHRDPPRDDTAASDVGNAQLRLATLHDIQRLAMDLESLQQAKDDPNKFSDLAGAMSETLESLRARMELAFDRS